MATEIVGGLLANSLAIMTDAAHLFSDVSGFFISIISLRLSQAPPDKKMSYGYSRAEVVGALASIVLIWALTVWLISEAIQRVITPPIVDAKIMLIIAVLALLFNLAMMKILHGGPGHSHGGEGGHSHGHGGEEEEEEGHSHAGEGKGAHKHKEGHSHGAGHTHKEGHKHSHGKHDKSEGQGSHNHDSDDDDEKEEENEENINIRAVFIHLLGKLILFKKETNNVYRNVFRRYHLVSWCHYCSTNDLFWRRILRSC
jgi:zinc transporter 2